MTYFHEKTIIGLIFASFALVGCVPKETAPPQAIIAPNQSAAVSPLVDQAKADAAKGGEVSAKLERQVETLRKNSLDLQHGFSAATNEAARLRAQKAASEKELDALWEMLNGTEARAKELFAEVEKAKAIADEQRDHRVLAEKRLDELAKAALARDTETLELRKQRDFLADENERAGKVIEGLKVDLRRADMKAAVGSYLKGVAWFIGIVLTLIAAFWVATKIKLI